MIEWWNSVNKIDIQTKLLSILIVPINFKSAYEPQVDIGVGK